MKYGITPDFLATECRVPLRAARRYLKANHAPSPSAGADVYGLTPPELARAYERLANQRQVECIGVTLSATRRQKRRGM